VFRKDLEQPHEKTKEKITKNNRVQGSFTIFVKVGGRSKQLHRLEGNKQAGNSIDWGGRCVIQINVYCRGTQIRKL
jgi:hypothetical protein